jgi:hypothetical protein
MRRALAVGGRLCGMGIPPSPVRDGMFLITNWLMLGVRLYVPDGKGVVYSYSGINDLRQI